jgi:hypothetical protein
MSNTLLENEYSDEGGGGGGGDGSGANGENEKECTIYKQPDSFSPVTSQVS